MESERKRKRGKKRESEWQGEEDGEGREGEREKHLSTNSLFICLLPKLDPGSPCVRGITGAISTASEPALAECWRIWRQASNPDTPIWDACISNCLLSF